MIIELEESLEDRYERETTAIIKQYREEKLKGETDEPLIIVLFTEKRGQKNEDTTIHKPTH